MATRLIQRVVHCAMLSVWVGACGSSEDAAQGADSGADASEEAGMDAGGESQTDDAGPCDSTWKAVQRSIFAGRGCVDNRCHGGDEPAGGLDLRPEVAYENLIYVDAQASLAKPLYRIHPGEQALSLLYLKVEAAAEEGYALPSGAGSPMPTGKDPLSAEQLAALRLWIRAGAPESGVVEGTQDLLDCELPSDADPNRSVRPPVPAADEGFQHVAGSWTVEPDSEDEVCFATYYDLSETAPDWAQFPCELGGTQQTCVGYKRRELSQDAQSHHSIISIYAGETAANDPAWGVFRCVGGDHDGTSCDPLKLGVAAEDGGADCGEDGVCQSKPQSSIACRGYGPQDRDTKSLSAGGAQSPVSRQVFPDGVYGELPIKGVVVWNSHGFNLTTKPAAIAQYNTFWYATPEERTYLVRRIFDIRNIFAMSVPPFQQREYCAAFTLPRYARLTELSSHVHKRGVQWRTWLPPNPVDCTPPSCEPNDGPPDYLSRAYNDPVTLNFDPVLAFDQADAAARTLKYCAVYDNGDEHPELLKEKALLPAGAAGCGAGETYCKTGPNKGEPCATDAECGDENTCDACLVKGGFTTEDEMFILLGSYYVQAP